MLEINPVLAGTFDAPGYMPAASNINRPADDSGDASQAANIDSRRYSQYDRTASNDVPEITDLSFGDVLDIINPLQHIPVLSSIYRAATHDEIRPFARVAGDVLYGGILGGVSAVTGAVGGVAEAAVEKETGKDVGATVIAALFGPDSGAGGGQPATQFAAAGKTPPDDGAGPPEPAAIPAAEKTLVADAGPVTAPAPSIAPSTAPAIQAAAPAAAPAAEPPVPGTIPLPGAKAFPLKQPYGGVMAPPNTQAQNMAIALSAAAPGIRLGHTIYTSPLMNGPHPLTLKAAAEPVTAAAAVPAAAPVAAPAAPTPPGPQSSLAGPHGDPLPPELMQDMMLKALSRYKSIAGGMTAPGGTINLTN